MPRYEPIYEVHWPLRVERIAYDEAAPRLVAPVGRQGRLGPERGQVVLDLLVGPIELTVRLRLAHSGHDVPYAEVLKPPPRRPPARAFSPSRGASGSSAA